MIRPRLFAGWAVALGVATGILVATPAPPAAAAPTHVAVVVAGVGDACVTAGGTGLDVLNRGFTVTIGQRSPYLGFVFLINGVGTTRPDNTHYWSYWQLTDSGWQYSTTGGAGYTPPAGSVEGWSYVDGESSAPPPPPSSYAQVCGGSDPPDPTPTTPVARPTSSAPAQAGGPGAPPRSTAPPRNTPPGHATTTAGRGPDATQKASNTATSTVAASHQTRSAEPTQPPASPVGRSMPSTRSGSATGDGRSAPPWGTVLGLVAVLLLGGSAAWWSRRRARP